MVELLNTFWAAAQDALLDRAVTAAGIGHSTGWMEAKATLGGRVPFLKCGHRVLYRKFNSLTWLKESSQLVRSTSEYLTTEAEPNREKSGSGRSHEYAWLCARPVRGGRNAGPGTTRDSGRIVRYGSKKRAWYRLREIATRSGVPVVVGHFGFWGCLSQLQVIAASRMSWFHARTGPIFLRHSSVRQILRVSAQKLDMARLPWDVKVLTI
jgi:hypothetical protein